MIKIGKKAPISDKIFHLVNISVVTLFLLSVLFPLIYIIAASLSDPEKVVQGKVWLWPVGFNLEGYRAVFENPRVITGYMNSLIIMVVGTSVNVVMTVLAGYPLSRRDFPDRHLFMGLFVFTMMFNGGLIPNYILVKNLGLIDSRWALILPGAIGAYNAIIVRTYFQTTIPSDLLEAAQMDGCSDFRFLARIVIPLSGPILAVITLFYAVGHWNQFFAALLYLKDESKYPLQIILREILVENTLSSAETGSIDVESELLRQRLRELLKYSLIIVASAPLMIMYPFIQKYFVKGIMIGSLKG